MQNESPEFAPYASVGSVLAIIDQLRQEGLPDPVTARWLTNQGLSLAVSARVLQTIRYLGLADRDDRRTPQADRLRNASEGREYQAVLAELVRTAYADIFASLPPGEPLEEAKIRNAFGSKEPAAVRDRMISLFLGLLKECGLLEGGPVSRGGRERPAFPPPPQPPPYRPEPAETTPRKPQSEREAAPPRAPVATAPPPAPRTPSSESKPARYPLMQQVIELLPSSGQWTPDERQNWLQLVDASVAVLIKVKPEPPNEK